MPHAVVTYPKWKIGGAGKAVLNDALVGNHFKVSEFACRCSYSSCSLVLISPYLVTHLQSLRNRTGEPLTITSGYRCPDHNQAIGGSPLSLHQFGLAADFYTRSVENMEDLCAQATGFPDLGGIGRYVKGEKLVRLHMDFRPRPSMKPFVAWTKAA